MTLLFINEPLVVLIEKFLTEDLLRENNTRLVFFIVI